MRDGDAAGCSTHPTGNLRFQAEEGVRGARACSQMVLTPGPDGHRPSGVTGPHREGAGRQGNKLVVSFTDGFTEAERGQGLGILIQSLSKHS